MPSPGSELGSPCLFSTTISITPHALNVTVIVVRNAHGDPGSNPGQVCLCFTSYKLSGEVYEFVLNHHVMGK